MRAAACHSGDEGELERRDHRRIDLGDEQIVRVAGENSAEAGRVQPVILWSRLVAARSADRVVGEQGDDRVRVRLRGTTQHGVAGSEGERMRQVEVVEHESSLAS